ncbi:GyrI-like domain-containing protein [Methanobacterium sp.]|uniref:GyrI-like domain-containing protein n=1 Tax=Methanobacterium sp. TaxID=2164 RepID=UPI00257C6567|nr:GyrI-like domain-containing protein [Methanobacterium sp.]
MTKIDLKKENKEFYYPSTGEVAVVDVPEMKFLMIDGQGDPNTSQEYKDAMETIFPVSYKTKFISKKEKSQDYVVMPLEGLWWADNMEDFSLDDKSSWKWTVMIRQPDFITKTIIDKAIKDLKNKKDLPAPSKLRFETFCEGKAVQIMHIGPYGEAEAPAVGKLHDFIENEGYSLRGKHHEIYISDMRRTKPEKLKTVIRQPFE